MEMASLNSIFTWVGIIAAFLSAFSFLGTMWTGNIIEKKRQEVINALEYRVVSLGPRTVTAEQKNILLPILRERAGTPIGFLIKTLDAESYGYAQELANVFREAGWNIVEPFNHSLLDDYNGKINVFIGPELQDREAVFEMVTTALNRAGISAKPQPIREGSLTGPFQQDALYLAIGAKVN